MIKIRIDTVTNRLITKSTALDLPPRLIALLVVFAENPNVKLTKDQIFESVWPGVFVSEDSIVQAISQLRRHLTNIGLSEGMIDTIRGVGYRLNKSPSIVFEIIAENQPKQKVPLPFIKRHFNSNAMLASTFVVLVFSYIFYRSEVPNETLEIIRLTNDFGVEHNPILSDDGSKIAYSYRGEDGYWKLSVVDTNQGNREQKIPSIPKAHHLGAVYTEEGDALIYAVRGSHTQEISDCSLYSFHFATDENQYVGDCLGSGRYFSRSNNGAHILFSARKTKLDPPRVVQLDVLTGVKYDMTSPPQGSLGDRAGRISEDGRELLFLRDSTSFTGEVFSKALSTGKLTKLMEVEGTLDWFSRQSNTIYYVKSYVGSQALYKFDLGRKIHKKIQDIPSYIDSVSASKSPFKVAIGTYAVGTSIDKISLKSPAEVQAVLKKSAVIVRPDVSPDGAKLAYIQANGERAELWLHDIKKNTTTQLLTQETLNFYAPQFSPDGSQLLVRTFAKDREQTIAILDLRLQSLKHIDTMGVEPSRATWRFDGKGIYYKTGLEKPNSIVALDLETGESRVLVPSVSGRYFVREDSSVIYGDNHAGTISRFFDGKKECLTCAIGRPVYRDHWDIYEDTIYYLSPAPFGLNMYALNWRTAEQWSVPAYTDILNTNWGVASGEGSGVNLSHLDVVYKGGASVLLDAKGASAFVVTKTKHEGDILLSGVIQ